jgi:hypothetical protein
VFYYLEPSSDIVKHQPEFQRAIGAPQSTYTDYRVGTRFACQVEIDDNGHTEVFGSLQSLYPTKKAARQEAAHDAIEYFRAQERWPNDASNVGGIKKKRKSQSDAPKLVSTTSPTTTESQRADVASSFSGHVSYAQQVVRLAATLSLPTPEWRYTPSPQDRDFHTIQCFFNNAGPHQGPIGEVRNVFGKKKAKEECARLTLAYLKEVYAQRLAYAQRMMEGISGGEGVEEGALGKPIEGEKDEADARRQFIMEMGGESDAEFEDAVEELSL